MTGNLGESAALDARAEGETPFVSVVMPARNEERWIERAVRSVLSQDYPREKLEVIVAVGASSDRTRETVSRLAAEDARIRLVDNPDGRTPVALNLAIAAARGDIVARVDAHGWLGAGYIARSVEALRRTGADAVGGVVSFVGAGAMGEAIAIAESSRLGGGTAAFRGAETETEADGLRWGVFRRAVFDRVGLFDEELVRNQDDEFCHRIRRAGGTLVVTPEMEFSQVVRSSVRDLWSQYRQWGEFRLATFEKHRRPAAVRQLAPPGLIGALAFALALDGMTNRRRRVFPRLALAYVGVVAIAGTRAAMRRRSARIAPLVPVAIATMHFAYGWGFWRAVAGRVVSGRRRER
jgi:cellulose synthase/poly-beta-1,6-N-acetylglucosamine synthase-like glycosyltransferase